MKQRKIKALLAAACLIAVNLISIFIQGAFCYEVKASSFFLDNKEKKVIIILVDNMEQEEFLQDPYLSKLYENSYAAYISGRQNGKASAVKAKLNIGAGKRLEVGNDMSHAYNYNPSSSNAQAGNVIYADLEKLVEMNQESEYSSRFSYLGNELKRMNKRTCVIGNSDNIQEDRSAVLIAMDSGGIVDTGDVEGILEENITFPGGRHTNYVIMQERFNQYYKNADFLVIDTGDLTRLEHHKAGVSALNYQAARKKTVQNISTLTSQIVKFAGKDAIVMLLSTYPSRKSLQEGFKLTELLVHDKNGGGLLYSSSTRRLGIITDLDIADYILSKFADTDKNNVHEKSAAGNLRQMTELKEKLLRIAEKRPNVLTWYAIFEIICAIMSFLYMILTKQRIRGLNGYFELILLSNIAAPVVLMYLPASSFNSAFWYFCLFIIISVIIGWIICKAVKNSQNRFAVAAALVNMSIALDLIRGSAFMKNSVFGYDPIIGARFYGIGNEYAGVFIGSGILLAGAFIQGVNTNGAKLSRRKWLALVLFSAFQVSLIGLPSIGANFGGAIAAIAGYYFFLCALEGKMNRVWQFALLPILMVSGLAVIVVLDMMNPGGQTHIARLFIDMKDNGMQVLLTTAARKAAMNLKLIKYTIWTKVLLCIILIIAIMFYKPVRLLRYIFRKYTYLTAAWIGISAGSIAGLAANDSGIVMAATAMIFTGYTIIYICLEERLAGDRGTLWSIEV